jgi:hypothetical protein
LTKSEKILKTIKEVKQEEKKELDIKMVESEGCSIEEFKSIAMGIVKIDGRLSISGEIISLNCPFLSAHTQGKTNQPA